ncbi:MAG: energy-coupling factor transporter transmembrane component T family protein [Thermoproteus sp. AZ2]|jgi:energy-coupling factor transport system permease protein|uniref:Energy-coupling factor transporter transmembrane component T family protein n=1 Tax=Thermoproteus sp. AZ2 TaxID=1609232 RepID=A0ACC6UZ13_9CREN|nr:MAG: cobalt transporter [Thermoproteus sp. AZ2]
MSELGAILYNPAVNWTIALVYLLWGPALVIYLIFKLIGFRGYMSLFRYAGGSTFLYRLDPRVKILLSIVVTTVAAMTVWWISAIIFIAVMALYAFTTNVGEKMRIVVPLVLASFIGTAWAQSIIAPYSYLVYDFGQVHFIYAFPQALSALGLTQANETAYVPFLGYVENPVGLTWEGIIYGLQITFRAVAAIASGLLLIFTTQPSDILTALEKSGLPIELGFTLLLAVSSVPKVLEASMTTLNALKARGVDLRPRGGTPFAAIASIGSSIKYVLLALVTIVVLTVKDAGQIAIAAEVRGFRASRHRTYYRDIKMGRADYIALGLLLALLALGIYLSGVPGFGAIPYNP